jgi:hypothetical protein
LGTDRSEGFLGVFRNGDEGTHNGFGKWNTTRTSSEQIATRSTNIDYGANKFDHLLFLDCVLDVAIQ